MWKLDGTSVNLDTKTYLTGMVIIIIKIEDATIGEHFILVANQENYLAFYNEEG